MTPSRQQDVSAKFVGLARAFDSFRSGGDELATLARNLLSLAFRDIEPLFAGGMVVPQIGSQAGREIPFHLESPGEESDALYSCVAKITGTFWSEGDVTSRDYALPSIPSSPCCILFPISLGFERPIGYFWAVVPPPQADATKARLEYVSKYLALAIKSEKAYHAIECLAKSAGITSTTSPEIAQRLSQECRKALSCDTVIVWVFDNTIQTLRTTAFASDPPGMLKVDMKPSQGLVGKCFTSYKTIMVDDLLDPASLRPSGVEKLHHLELVQQRRWRSTIIVPLDIGGQAAGVMAAYGTRPRGFSSIDLQILLAFANRLSAGYAHSERLKQLSEMEQKLEIEAPSIEAGMLAMENVHDSVNSLTLAQDQLARILTVLLDDKFSVVYRELRSALGLVTTAKKGIAALANRSKFSKVILASVELQPILDRAIATIAPAAEDIGVHLHFSLSTDATINADKDKLHRVFVNILENSLWFLEHDSKSGKQIDVSIQLATDSITAIFRDNGPGIAPYDLSKIFDYLFTTKGDRGMGFGLAISRRIIRAHGGDIAARSHWGRWTEITVILPRIKMK